MRIKELWTFNRYNYLFMLLVLCAGLLVYKDFGISWDEPAQLHNNGYIVYEYVFLDSTQAYLNSGEKYHGAIIELGLYTMMKWAKIESTRSIFLMRHLVSFIFYWISGFFLIGILNQLYKNKWVTLTGLAMYFLAPRIFPDAFYNSKDVPILATCTMSIFTFIKLYRKPNFKNALFHALVCGLITGIRISGIIIPILSIIVLGISLLERKEIKKRIIYTFLFAILTIPSIIVFWPILWLGPWFHFHAAWVEMSRYNWDNAVLYMGQFVSSLKLPWHYVPFWIYVTTPPLYLVLFTGSLGAFLVNFYNKRLSTPLLIELLFLTGLFFVPIFSVIYFKSVLYDGWRHLYFLYVPLVVISCYVVSLFFESRFIYKKYAGALLVFAFSLVLRSMIVLHPYEHVYFNKLYYKGVDDARFEMEMDYWGLAYQEALRYILDHDDRAKIRVRVDTEPGIHNLSLLKEYQKERLEVDLDHNRSHDYLIGNYRWRQSEYNEGKEIYAITRQSAKLCTIIKLEH